MTDYPYYNWKYEPDDGEYELQFDRFETSADGDRHDLAILLIADTDKDLREEGRLVGDVAYPTVDVPEMDRNSPATTRIYHAIIEDNEIAKMTYKPEISKQRHEEAQKQYDRLTGKTDESDG